MRDRAGRRKFSATGHWIGPRRYDLRGSHVSGAHYNPAVSLGVLVRGRLEKGLLPGYWIGQVVAAIVAAVAVLWLKSSPEVAPLSIELPKALVAEFLSTFALVNTVLNVATAKGTSGNSFYGFAIGFTVLAGAYAVGGVSGGAFNPAVTVGLIVFGKLTAVQAIAYIVTQLVAAIAAGALFKMLNPTDA